MKICADRAASFDYMRQKVGLTWSDDFRGMLFVPNKLWGLAPSLEHVVAAFGFNNFVGRTACFHVSVTNGAALNKHNLKEVFDYAFNVCGLVALLAAIDSTNVPSCKFAKKVGGRLIHTVKDGGLDGDLHCFQMLREECPWLPENQHGKKFATAA